MTINLKNFLNDKNKMSKMGEFQNLKQIEGLEMSSVSADLYSNGRDDLSLFYFKGLPVNVSLSWASNVFLKGYIYFVVPWPSFCRDTFTS